MLENFENSPPTSRELHTFYKNRELNPRTHQPFEDTNIMDTLLLSLERFFFKSSAGINQIDPILLEKLPLKRNKPVFNYAWEWDPMSGERLNLATDGGLFFDPDTLIHYFYTLRLNNLWCSSMDDYAPFYGDALGTGPQFYIKGRGFHPEWYLFRLPLMYKYLPEGLSLQIPTLMPPLSEADLTLIDHMGDKYGRSYKKRFGRDRPSLVKMKALYEVATDPFPKIQMSAKETLQNATKAEKYRRRKNKEAVDELRYI